jgi:hypothetical protein
VSVSDIGLTLGFATAGGTCAGGGCIRNHDSALDLNRVVVTTCQSSLANTSGGGILNCADDGSATLTVTESTIKNNSMSGANVSGAGIASVLTGGASGGGSGSSTVTLERSTVSDNFISTGDDANGEGGGIAVVADVFSTGTATLHLINSTVSGNRVTRTTNASGGGISAAAELFSDGVAVVAIASSTITDNIATSTVSGNGAGGGLHEDFATFSIKNTVVAGNTADSGPDADGSFTSLGYNLIANTASSTGFGGTDLLNQPALLDVLADNGGATETHGLLPGSPAIDAANPAGCTDPSGTPLSSDQRGEARTALAACDIGSFEVGPIPAVPALPWQGTLVLLLAFAAIGMISVMRSDSPAPVRSDS